MTDRHNERERLAAHMGRVLREARQRASLTQADVAECIGLTTEVLGRTERGHIINKAPLWLEAPEPAAQLSVVSSTANALLRHTGQRPDDHSE